MSAVTVTLRTEASEVPAVIAGSVNLLRFTEALARAGLVGRHDGPRGVFVIEPVPAPCPQCGGSGLDEDARCEACGGAGQEHAAVPRKAQELIAREARS